MSHYTAIVISLTKPDEDNPYGDATEVFEDYEVNDLIRGEGCETLDTFFEEGDDGLEDIRDMLNYGTNRHTAVVPMPELKCVEITIDPEAVDEVLKQDLSHATELFREMTFDEFRLRCGKAYELGKLLAGTTFDDIVIDRGDYQPVREWVSQLDPKSDPLRFWIVQAFDIDP